MKSLILILWCATAAGCALVAPTQPVHYSEATFPAAVHQALANQAYASIAIDFNARHVRLGFIAGFDRFAIAPRLDTLLRESGYEVTTEMRHAITTEDPRQEGKVTATISYSVEPASPGCLYFTISVGPDWRLARMYAYTTDGDLQPVTPATIKRNRSDAR